MRINFRVLLAVVLVLVQTASSAQTYNGATGAIPDNGATPTCFPAVVTGVGTINSNYGLASVCLNITHAWVSDLEITLTAPDGTVVDLCMQEGGSGDNFTSTCFTSTATVSITVATAPFTGNFLPETPMGVVNNGQNANGTWNLCIQDVFGSFAGTLNSWSLSFSNTPAPPPPVQPPCSGNAPAGNTCVLATPVCNFNGYCGNTSSSYTSNTWPELSTAFCGSLENNSFVTFVASSTTASFNVWVTNSQNDDGIQMMFYDGGCGSGAVNEYGCYTQILPSPFPSVITATGLTPGNTYYLMFDGWAGDVCDYSIAPISGVNILDIATNVANATVCIGESVNLTASGGNGTYTWTGPGLNTTTGPSVIATPPGTATYTVTSTNTAGDCPLSTSVNITVTAVAPPPIVSTPLVLCQNAATVPLTANGTSLLWYAAATGGTGSPAAPFPNTTTLGTTTYYVSQTLSCGESVREPLVVNVIAATPSPAVGSFTFCQNGSATPLSATGSNLLWYTAATGGTGSATAPTPSTATAGNFTYYVTQTGGCGESPRTPVPVTITAAPPAPTVNSPLIICLGAPTSPLTATGTSLLWYPTATGGVGNPTAPTPSSAAVSSVTYYVTQTVGTCQSPRAALTVTVVASTPPPTVTTPVTYCAGAAATPLTATGSGLLWYTAATGGTGSATAPTPSTASAGSITYFVSQTSTCGEGPRTPLVVNINPIPPAPVVAGDVTYCVGATATPLTATGNSLFWYTVPVGGNGVSSLIPSTAAVGTTPYYVSQTISGCTSPRATLNVVITGLPPAPAVTIPSVRYCQNATATALDATGSSLLWYLPGSTTGSATAPVPSTSQAGTFVYTVTQTQSCGTSPAASITVIIDSTPPAPAISSPVVYCQGVPTIALTATGNQLLWYTEATGGTGSTTAPIPGSATTGDTDYYVSATLGVCEGPRANIRVTINPTPDIPSVTTPVTYCRLKTAIPLTATGTLLSWYTVASGGTGSSSAPVPSTQTVGSITYYVSQTLGVCEGPRTPIDVDILTKPDLGSDQADTICFAGEYNLNPVFNTTGLDASWMFGGNAVLQPDRITEEGFYTLEVTHPNQCTDTALFKLNIRPPVIANAGKDTLAVKGAPHRLFATGGERYLWSPAQYLDLATAQSPMATVQEDQLFIVTAYNSIGCSGKDSVFLKVYKGPAYYMPNAFTPNGDGMNDVFRPVPVGIKYTEWFRIYNRNGQLVFSSNKWLRGWDGSLNGTPQPGGAYVWMIKGIDRNNNPVELKGTVLLIR